VDFSLYLKAVVMGVVEGVTEFLPISSTGHLILAGGLLGFDGEKAKLFEIVIQTGAMLAVVWEYRVKFLEVLRGIFRDRGSRRFVMNLVIAFIPAAVVGVIFGDYIKARLFAPIPVALAFIIGRS
jgi:undecaprenyl-diphosphatase